MLDFLMISNRSPKKGTVEIFPKFLVGKKNDLMIRGGDFYAVWDEKVGLWSSEEQRALELIDEALDNYANEFRDKTEDKVKVLHMWDGDSGMIDKWHKYCQRQMRDNYHMLDEKLIFSNVKPKKRDYASKVLDYPLEKGETAAYDELMSVLYSPEERAKIEWAIGSVITGDSKEIQKFIVLYGAAGTGKSTVLNIIQQLFEGYYSVFDAKALGSSNNAFALEAFKSNPLVAIQHDGDLSRIEDNTRLNSLVSHEVMTVNEKFKSTYSNKFISFLFMGTNKPVKITDGKSGLIRRLIDVSPTGDRVHPAKYKKLVNQIKFELGGIAYHCREVYLQDPGKYDNYVPIAMLGASNDFYNFVLDSYFVFKREEYITLKTAWEMYKQYCSEARVPYPFSQRIFKEELKNYFKEFKERLRTGEDSRARNVYFGFRYDKFDEVTDDEPDDTAMIIFAEQESEFDKIAQTYPAQYANEKGTPKYKWANVKTTLADIDTHELHYVQVPANHIVIDFDIPNEEGGKSYERNLIEASKWPATYAELSKSGAGIHLHYIYEGDVSKLKSVYADHIEIKVFNGKGAIRRKLTKCNNHPISKISSGLPTKGDKPVIKVEQVKSEKALRDLIKRNLAKEIHPGTKPSIDFIVKILDDAYESDLSYDVSDMRGTIFAFAANSTHQAEYCIEKIRDMKFQSKEFVENDKASDNGVIIFYDIEVFPNLLLVNWKAEGPDHPIVRLINPTPSDIEDLIQHKLVGFNCRRYDNHILYGRLLGYTNEQIYELSTRIINGEPNCFFMNAYNISYTDVFDFCSKKQSLKKWEIELGIHHQELGFKWDEPIPEELWPKVAEYCDNDVLATEAVFNARKADFVAREILADVAGMTVNDTTNSLTTKIIFGNDRRPQSQFNYRDLAAKHPTKPYFPGYEYKAGKSTYRGEIVGEGGYVYAEPGIHYNVALLDIASMHPTSVVAEELFGQVYTKRFKELLDARIAIKHKDFAKARKMLNGALAKYLTDEDSSAALAQALKIAINSVYGLTAAKFDNPFRDIRNKDNIVAKRGALFMIDLKHAVQERGYTVAHIKTDSIKIPNADEEIIRFVTDFGKTYGYTFEHEATYSKMCLVNDAVYIAKYKDGGWTATGTQFQVPYVFKKLFSKEPITFNDLCETKTVSTALYLDMNENLPDVDELEKVAKIRSKGPSRRREEELLNAYSGMSDEELAAEIAKGHNYIFVGRIGQFCPILDGRGGGILLREKDGKFYSVTGTKGYRWLESEMVSVLGKEKDIDLSYYENLCSAAKDEIDKYGDFGEFAEWTTLDTQ